MKVASDSGYVVGSFALLRFPPQEFAVSGKDVTRTQFLISDTVDSQKDCVE